MKIISLNIEGDKHLNQVNTFIQVEKPDIVCLQEIFKEDFIKFRNAWKMVGKFMPTVNIDEPGRPGFNKRGVFGIAILGRGDGVPKGKYYFKRRESQLPRYRGFPNAGHRALVWHTWIEDGQSLTVATTHFTWSKKGRVTEKQRREVKSLVKLIQVVRPDVLCGDFNAPRGGEIFNYIGERLIDRIPKEISTTLDSGLHYAGKLNLVVDGFFTQPWVLVKKLTLVNGISDHCAIVATGVTNINS